MALKGNETNKAEDILKDPYVFEYLGLPEDKPMMESNLEEALVRQIDEAKFNSLMKRWEGGEVKKEVHYKRT